MGRHGACSATGRKDLDSPDGPGHSHSDCVGLTFSKPATCEDAASIYNGISSGLWMIWTVLLTGSYGMSFTHKFSGSRAPR